MKIILMIVNTILIFVQTMNALHRIEDIKTITILSLENKKCVVEIIYNFKTDVINIRLSPQNSLCINGFRGFVDSIRVINHNFIELHFQIRSGTGIRQERYILLCISEDKLYKAIDVLSLIDSRFEQTYIKGIDSLHLYDEKNIDRFRFIDLRKIKNSFVLEAEEYHYEKSKYYIKNNYELCDTIVLLFEPDYKIFYNQFKSISGDYIVDSDDITIHKKQTFGNEQYPMLNLFNTEYYFIDNEWYIKDQNKHLTLFSSNCR